MGNEALMSRVGRIAAVFILPVCLGACRQQQEKATLRVFHADSLLGPFGALERAFEQEHPAVDIVQIPTGSVLAVRKVTGGGDWCDVLVVADPLLIRQMPEGHADWSICLAANELVVAYTNASRRAAELTGANWFEVLTRPEVRLGAANPYHDPCGYWTMLCWRLADLHYPPAAGEPISARLEARCGPPRDRRSDSEELIALLESAGGIDYAFVYRSQALQHHLSCLRLPPEINLGDVRHTAGYARARIELPSADGTGTIQKEGQPIVYAATILRGARRPDLAEQYLAFAVSPRGRAILAEQGLTPMEPWSDEPDRLPEVIRTHVTTRPWSAAPSQAVGPARGQSGAARTESGEGHE